MHFRRWLKLMWNFLLKSIAFSNITWPNWFASSKEYDTWTRRSVCQAKWKYLFISCSLFTFFHHSGLCHMCHCFVSLVGLSSCVRRHFGGCWLMSIFNLVSRAYTVYTAWRSILRPSRNTVELTSSWGWQSYLRDWVWRCNRPICQTL